MQAWIPPPLPLLLLLGALGACTKPTATSAAPVAACTSAGQQCQYADGKIGLCTANGMDCDGGQTCLVCMSLH